MKRRVVRFMVDLLSDRSSLKADRIVRSELTIIFRKIPFYTGSMSRYEEFQAFRMDLNEKILSRGTKTTKRFFTLDSSAYEPGAIDAKTKELLGLSASMVLRCDDCIAYHIDQAVIAGASDEELFEVFDIALIVGGSIVIPHLRRGVQLLEECRSRG